MTLLFCGDVVGRSGREVVLEQVPILKRKHHVDMVIVNGDNAANGFGITAAICESFFSAGVDLITGGDHIWDQKDMAGYIGREKRLLRPHNFPAKTPGTGIGTHTLADGRRIGVLHLLGQVFHKEYLDCPFTCAERMLAEYRLGHDLSAIFVDFHAEATSEKNAMGVYLDGKVSAVIGSHTHVPTADARILENGTAYQTDAGMCGDYHNSVIGFHQTAPLDRFLTKLRRQKMQPASQSGTLGATLITIDSCGGMATSIRPLLTGGALGSAS